MTYDRAYAPFGEPYAETATTNRDFTGQTQDTTPGLYDFLFRQLSTAQGRWLVPDPAGLAAVDLTNPQTWNRYAYATNSPLSNIDILGLDTCWRDSQGNWHCDLSFSGEPPPPPIVRLTTVTISSVVAVVAAVRRAAMPGLGI